MLISAKMAVERIVSEEIRSENLDGGTDEDRENSMGLIDNILDRGYYFSENEAMCLLNNGQAILKKLPKERILTETDAPYDERTNI